MTEPEFDAVVRTKTLAAEGVAELLLARPPGGELPAWEPGAHIDLVPATGPARQYSLCGDPADRSCYRIAVLR
ncbi:MAG TPA: oxidoreductase, partial [Streptomyces sp.]